jgi:hypothetical protein
MEPRKHLYNEGYESSTAEGNALFVEFCRAIGPIFKRMCAEGYSVREVAHTAFSAVGMTEAETVLLRNLEEHKREQEIFHGRRKIEG